MKNGRFALKYVNRSGDKMYKFVKQSAVKRLKKNMVVADVHLLEDVEEDVHLLEDVEEDVHLLEDVEEDVHLLEDVEEEVQIHHISSYNFLQFLKYLKTI